ncbi:MAG TPA: hypothetical protein VGB85_34205, partial [Nannocystis sp.]
AAAISALCWAIETMRTYQAELMTTERDRLTIPAEVVRLESLATGLAAPCLAKKSEPPSAATASTGAGAPPTADPRQVSDQREGPEPPPAPTRIRRTRPQIAIGSTLLITGAGLAAGFAGCFVASGHERAQISALGARAEEAGRDPTNEEWAEAATADARAIRLARTGTTLGVFAVASVLAGFVVLMLPRRSTSRVQARPVGPGVRINF